MQCSRKIQGYIPDFDVIFDNVRGEDNYTNLFDEYYQIYYKTNLRDFEDEEGELSDEKEKELEERAERDANEEVERDAREKYNQIVDVINDRFSGSERIRLFREMKVNNVEKFVDDVREHGKSEYLGVLTGVGIFWSFDKYSAEVQECGGGVDLVVLECEAHCEDIDYMGTIIAYMTFEGENEIRLNEDAEIFLINIYEMENHHGKLLRKFVMNTSAYA